MATRKSIQDAAVEDYHSAMQGVGEADGMEECGNFVSEDVKIAAYQGEVVREDTWYRALSFGADCVYMEPPWRNGYYAFYERVGIDPELSFRQWQDAVVERIKEFGRPAVLVMGDSDSRVFEGQGAYRVDTRMEMHGQNTCKAVVFNDADGTMRDLIAGRGKVDSGEILSLMANTFGVVYDPCCGYGRSAKFFLAAGKRAVQSDINPKCVGYIKHNYEKWILR